MTPEFWKGKKVFVTGHTGFKGAWLMLLLQRLGAEATGFSHGVPTEPSLFRLCGLEGGPRDLRGDVRDGAALAAVLRKVRPEVVIHMAAQALVRPSYEAPVDTFAVNVMGTVHVLEAIRETESIRAAVMVTSDKCYDNREWEWGYREGEPLGGRDPYSASKACAEIVTDAMRRSFFNGRSGGKTAVASARAGNVIGGGDWARDRLVPDIMNALMERRPVVLRHPDALRPWQHVLEPLSGYLTLAERLWTDGPAHAEAWNFGPSDEDARPVRWIADRLIREWGAGEWRLEDGDHPHEAKHLRLDCSKARARLGWRPRWDLGTALGSIAAWYRAYTAKEDMGKVVARQLDAYFSAPAGAA